MNNLYSQKYLKMIIQKICKSRSTSVYNWKKKHFRFERENPPHHRRYCRGQPWVRFNRGVVALGKHSTDVKRWSRAHLVSPWKYKICVRALKVVELRPARIWYWAAETAGAAADAAESWSLRAHVAAHCCGHRKFNDMKHASFISHIQSETSNYTFIDLSPNAPASYFHYSQQN